MKKSSFTIVESACVSDSQRALLRLAEELVVAAQSVSLWVNTPASHELAEITAHITRRHDALQQSIAAYQETDVPSLSQLEWRCQVASDKSSRAWNEWDALADDWGSPAWNAARTSYEAAYQAYLQTRRALRAHPNWTPKRQKKTRVNAVGKKKAVSL